MTKGDVYSFAIICSQIVTRTSPFNLENRKEHTEELLYMLKKGVNNPPRPDLTPPDDIELNPAMYHLIRDCWSEIPSERPEIDKVRTLMRSMQRDSSGNLMDHVLSIMEQHAEMLEQDIANRTKELIEEKTKSDLLLYRMLPRSVADRLKTGQSVPPESYEKASIFFSDVVSFTKLAQRCTPMQVVTLLNGLYTIFDSVIESHDVYKVETIGDGYLCASGLPKRNGNEHIKEIADMSLELMKKVSEFRVPHLPQERIQIRIGLHTGPCVTGVVGLTMPRYCLFGDTVNTASRMESSGKPSCIHISDAAKEFMHQVYPDHFLTEVRGEISVKGKGVMLTHWLLGYRSHYAHSECSEDFIPDEPIIPRSMYNDYKRQETTRIDSIERIEEIPDNHGTRQ